MNFDTTNIPSGSIKPCPVCTKPMTIRKTSAMVEGGHRKWFFFLYCSQCGYGPHNAFDSIFQAINHWNETALNALPPIELFAQKPANFFTPRMFN